MADDDDAARTALLPAATLPRGRTVQVGTAFAIAAVLMYFGGLFGIYLAERSVVRTAGLEWIPGSVDIQLTAPSIILWTYIISMPLAAWAVYAIRRDDRKHAYMAFALVLLLGAMTINQAAYNFDSIGAVADNSRAETLIFLIGGSHMVLTLVGMLFFLFTAFRALAGQFSSRYSDAVAAAAMFWYVIVFLYFIIWLLITVSK